MTQNLNQRIQTLLDCKLNNILESGKYPDAQNCIENIKSVVFSIKLPSSASNKVLNDIFAFWSGFTNQNPWTKTKKIQNLFYLYLLSDFEKIYYGPVSDSLIESNGKSIAKGSSNSQNKKQSSEIFPENQDINKNNNPDFQKMKETFENILQNMQIQNIAGIQANLKDEDVFTALATANNAKSSPFETSISDIESRLFKIQKNKKLMEFIRKIGEHKITPRFYQAAISCNGIYLSNDLKNLLQSELALHKSKNGKIEFFRRYAQRQLLCYKPGEDKDFNKKKKNIGPVILCLDTSSSMKGEAELTSKAICLLLAKLCSKKNRELCIINFSVDFKTIKLKKQSSSKMISKLLVFLKESFNGGTEIGPAFENAFKILDEKDFCDADILIISDFITRPLTQESINNIQDAKDKGTRFFGLCIETFQNANINQQLKTIIDEYTVWKEA